MAHIEQEDYSKKENGGLLLNERIELDSLEVLIHKMTIEEGCVREPDEICLAINVTYRNNDTERKRVDFGALFIMYNEKEYVFARSNTDWHDGWEIVLDYQESKTTDLVYKIPFEIHGPVYYEPECNYYGSKIYLGKYEMGQLMG
jgi:hypothetical protein